MRLAVSVAAGLLLLLGADHYFGEAERARFAGGAINESFIRKGTLGDLLMQNGLIQVSSDTAEMATSDMCASYDELSGFDYHNTFRLRLKIETLRDGKKADLNPKLSHEQHSLINIGTHQVPLQGGEIESALHQIEVEPRRKFYSVPLRLSAKHRLSVELRAVRGSNFKLHGAWLDGRYGRSFALKIGNSRDSSDQPLFESSLDRRSVIVSAPFASVKAILAGGFPGKKNRGFCRYVAATHAGNPNAAEVASDRQAPLIPIVNLQIAEDDLEGEEGIRNTKHVKGRAVERPAVVSTRSNAGTFERAVGLRFHGGVPGRKKDINAYRIYARDDYGTEAIPFEAIFNSHRAIDLKTVVFKYTYQAYWLDKVENFNLFNHVFALNIGERIGAIVPAHGLVDLYLNGESQGVYLAMEHLSDRTVENWLGHDEFTSVTYKKAQTEEQISIVSTPMQHIRRTKGEAAFELLQKYYDINNVLNSMFLTAYIADDDSCQGMEVFDHKTETLLTINWDLDHGFLKPDWEREELSIDADRVGYFLVHPKMHAGCSRARVYGWVYKQSETFRKLFRQRLESLLTTTLSADKVVTMLEPYRAVNGAYYAGSQDSAIADLERFARERPAVLLKRLALMETYVEELIQSESLVSR